MKITVIATGNSPFVYRINGEVITAVKDGVEDAFDLSALETGGTFEGVSSDTLDLPGSQIIRSAHRDELGVLHVTLTQKSPLNGHYRGSEEFDASAYVPGNKYYRELLTDGTLRAFPPEFMFDRDGNVVPVESEVI